MKRFITKSTFLFFSVLVLSMLSTVSVFAVDKVSTGTGNWSDATKWNPAGVPAANDNVFIEAGHTITVDGDYACANFNISTTGVLTVGASILTINGKIRAYTGAYPGTSSTNPAVTCITTTTGKVVFTLAGAITSTGEWGANPHSWRAEFDISGGGTATIATNFKAGDIIISGGTLNVGGNDLRPDKNAANTGTLTIDDGAKVQFTSGRIQRTGTAGTPCLTITINGTLEYTGTTINGAFAGTYNTSQGTLAYTANGAQALVTYLNNFQNLILGGSGTKTYNHTSNFSISNNGTVRIEANNTNCIFDATNTGVLSYGNNCTLISNSSVGFYNLESTTIDVWPATNGPSNVTVTANVLRIQGTTTAVDRTIPGTLTLNGGGLTVKDANIIRFGNDANIIRNTANGELKNVGSGILHFGDGTGSVDVAVNVACDATQELPSFGTNIFGQIGTFTINGNYNVPLATGLQTKPVTDLVFTSGKITLGDNNVLKVNNSISGASSTKYVITSGLNSGLKRNVGATAVDFSVGPDATLYHPATITNSGTADDFTVRVSSTLADCVLNVESVNATWDISETVPGGSNCTLELDYSGASTNAGYNSASAEVIHCNGVDADWSEGSVTGTVATVNNVSTFSPFGISSNLSIVLPVSLLEFEGRQIGKNVVLDWSLQQHEKTNYFVVESSADNSQFTALGKVDSRNIGVAVQKYSFVDPSPFEGANYYRIKQVDKDGLYSYSKVVYVRFTPGSDNGFGVVPNLLKPGQSVRINTGSFTGENDYLLIGIFNASGHLVQKQEIRNLEIDILNTSELNAGLYLVKALNRSDLPVARFVIMH